MSVVSEKDLDFLKNMGFFLFSERIAINFVSHGISSAPGVGNSPKYYQDGC